VLAQWWQQVASSEALDPLHWPMHAVSYRRIAMAIKTARKVGVFIHRCVVDCRPGISGSNTERVVAQWRHLVASDMALDILHRAMPHESLQCLRMAIEMACDGGAFVRRRRLFCLA
jgi:hypothetical protein